MIAHTDNDQDHQLSAPSQLRGFQGQPESPSVVLLKNNHLHIEIVIDRAHQIGASSRSGVCDIVLESAITVIQDCEDSVAAVDGPDKTEVYRNWLGLMKGTLSTTVKKGAVSFQRRLNADRYYFAPDGTSFSLPGRALMLVRNVGHLMTNPAILDDNGKEVFEGIIDSVVTALIALHDLNDSANRNSRAGAMYVVKPKMHGPEEVQFTVELFERTEKLLNYGPRNHESWHHGRGATNQRQSQGMYSCRCGPGHLYQHGIFRPNRRRNSYVNGSRTDDSKIGNESAAMDYCV